MSRNRRKTMLITSIAATVFLIGVVVYGMWNMRAAMETDFVRKNLPPSVKHPFGTDWMGRDMFARTISGLALSIQIGLLAATVSALLAFALGAAAASMGRVIDSFITWLIDLAMGIPHMLLLILVAFAVGKGFWGVVTAVTLTHWMGLARVIRAEIMQLNRSGYVQVAGKLGASRMQVVRRHMIPHVLPQFIVGLVLLFPHAILHEAGLTFLGFGLPPEQPAIGIVLAESMRYLATGHWWLAVFPGIALVTVVMLFDHIGSILRKVLDPVNVHE